MLPTQLNAKRLGTALTRCMQIFSGILIHASQHQDVLLFLKKM
jgi:hypothetical protein